MKYAVFAPVLTLVMAAPVNATPTISFTQNNDALPGYTTATVFQNFESAQSGGAQYAPRVGEATTGDVRVYTNTVTGTAVDPHSGPTSKYLSIENGSYSVTFGTPVQFFSFVLGSLDAYNSLTLTFASGVPQTFSGRQIIGDAAVGPVNSSTSGRVSINLNGGPSLISATFASTQQAFEIDDLASAVPEAATWAMMLVGIGTVGAVIRRRKVKTTVSYA